MNYDNLKKFFTELTDIVYQERITVLLFFLVFALMQVFSYFYNASSSPAERYDIVLLSTLSDSASAPHNSPNAEGKTQRLFPFNPGIVDYSELLELGFSPKVANILIHYREKGGRFFKKEDVKKIYGVSHELYARIEPYIAIPNRDYPSDFKGKFEDRKPTVIDINHASFEEWKALPGIGDFYANKFVSLHRSTRRDLWIARQYVSKNKTLPQNHEGCDQKSQYQFGQ
jgi:competence protein ComEA